MADGLHYHPDKTTACTLFGGTSIAQARGAARGQPALGVVCRTRFFSAKGQLIRCEIMTRGTVRSSAGPREQCSMICLLALINIHPKTSAVPQSLIVSYDHVDFHTSTCRSILFPPEHEQSFVNDSLIFISFMLVGCVALFIWAAVVLKSIGATDLKVRSTSY
jgi:cation-transporting ATPase 13A3/4/5